MLVSIGGSYDASSEATPTSRPATSRCWTPWTAGPCTCRATPTRCPPLLRAAAGNDDRVYVRLSTQENKRPHGTGRSCR